MKLHGLKKTERLNKDVEIKHLFSTGKHHFAYPILAFYVATEQVGEVAILCSVAKKRFKHAVDRNRVKRLMRETFRLNRTKLTQTLAEQQIGLHLAFVMSGNRMISFEKMNHAMQTILDEVLKDLQHERPQQ
ncbi:MAG: ribonuclease P protein component [Bacteroidales bacterium]|nr:ribonuclease P protein component [Bacteroidales bacterium]